MTRSHKQLLEDAMQLQIGAIEDIKRIKRAKNKISAQIEHTRKTLAASYQILKKTGREELSPPDESFKAKSD